jgi:hypothetical protein
VRLQAAAERQLREKGELPTAAGGDSAAAPTANGNAAAEGSAAAAAAADGAAGGEDQVAKKIKNTTKEILDRMAGPGKLRLWCCMYASAIWVLTCCEHVGFSVKSACIQQFCMCVWLPFNISDCCCSGSWYR